MAATVVQYTSRPFSIALTGDGSIDLSTATAAHLLVHRQLPGSPPPAQTVETWTASVRVGATATSAILDVPLLGSTPGVQAVTTANEQIRMRPYLSFPGGAPDVEFAQVSMSVVEA
jgi:hypothetical protein